MGTERHLIDNWNYIDKKYWLVLGQKKQKIEAKVCFFFFNLEYERKSEVDMTSGLSNWKNELLFTEKRD